jgi:hypothetical protein
LTKPEGYDERMRKMKVEQDIANQTCAAVDALHGDPAFVTNPGSEPSWAKRIFCDTRDGRGVWTNAGRAGLLDGPHISNALPGQGAVKITMETIRSAMARLQALGVHFPKKRR